MAERSSRPVGLRLRPSEHRTLLFFGDLVVEEPGLSVPHPEAHLRAFVLAPLAELEPDFVHPILGETIAAILARLPKESGVRKGGRLWT